MRVPNWEKALARALDTASRSAFVYGETDCAMFAASVVTAITGKDYGASFRNTYYDKAGAESITSDSGGMSSLLSEVLATPKLPATMASRGDVVVLFMESRRELVGICDGADAVFMTLTGLRRVPIERCAFSWSI